MLHPNTQTLIDTWRTHREGRRLPARTDLSPIDLGPLLPQVFMLGREPDGEEVFRLCGGLMADLHGRDLRASSFFSLWSMLDRPQIAATMARARSGAAPAIITLDAANERGESIGVEMCLAPLTGPSGEADRTLGPLSADLHRRPPCGRAGEIAQHPPGDYRSRAGARLPATAPRG